MIKSPFNWVGNKYRYIDIINKLILNKQYENVYEPFLGTGNVLLNIQCNATNYFGNDIIYLIPEIYNFIKNDNYVYTLQDFEDVETKYNNFSVNADYYDLRSDWNTQYLNKNYSREFVIKTIMLLKMCSNSMVRFNSKNQFNQGFRGITDGNFFKDITKINIIDSLNDFSTHLKKNNFIFTHDNYFNINFKEDSLLIIDPPYLLSEGIYSSNIDEQLDKNIIEKMLDSNCDFLYFSYENNNGKVNNNIPLLSGYNKMYLSTSDCSGQNRSTSIKSVKEVLFYKIK